MSQLSTAPVQPYPGVLVIDREGLPTTAMLSLHPASGWLYGLQHIESWKHHVHVIEKSALTPALREELCMVLPEECVSTRYPLAQRGLRATHLVVINDDLRVPLLERGVRVYTVGYHRVPDILRIIGAGGGRPGLWIEQPLYNFYFTDPEDVLPVLPSPRGRPESAPWYGYGSPYEYDKIDRILRAATDGVLDYPSFHLACSIDFDGWNTLGKPMERRRALRKEAAEIEAELAADMSDEVRKILLDSYYDRESAEDSWDDHLKTTFGVEPPPATLAASRALAAGELEQLTVYDFSKTKTFWREYLPPMSLVVDPPMSEGWFPPVDALWGDAPPVMELRYLSVPACHRYVWQKDVGG